MSLKFLPQDGIVNVDQAQISYLNPLGCAPKDEKVEISTSKIMEGE